MVSQQPPEVLSRKGKERETERNQVEAAKGSLFTSSSVSPSRRSSLTERFSQKNVVAVTDSTSAESVFGEEGFVTPDGRKGLSLSTHSEARSVLSLSGLSIRGSMSSKVSPSKRPSLHSNSSSRPVSFHGESFENGYDDEDDDDSEVKHAKYCMCGCRARKE